MSGSLPMAGILGDSSVRGVLLASSRDPDAKMTFLLTGATPRGSTGLVCKIPTTEAARNAVRREAQALVELRRMPLGGLSPTIPRYVSSAAVSSDNSSPPTEMLVSSQLPGTPMGISYHQWRHTARRGTVARDFDLALGWLESLWAETRRAPERLSWAGDVAESLARRWDGNISLEPAVERLQAAHQAMSAHVCPRTNVHGDFWAGNVLLDNGSVSGVVDWEAAESPGWPVRDSARFLLSYSLYLDRHTRRGRPVRGHPGLRRSDNGCALEYALLRPGWYPSLFRARLARGLGFLGLPDHLWYAVALTGIGEVAATANHQDFAHDHLRLLARLPHRPAGLRRRGR